MKNMSERAWGNKEAEVMPVDSRSDGASQGNAWQGKPSTYYGTPLLKRAHWGWQIILYFFLGGIAGGSYLVASMAHLLGLSKADALIRAGRYLAFLGILASPVLLIWDLGRPWRFHHMLRIFKVRSVMSLGTWGLTLFGMCCGLSTAHQASKDGFLNWFPRAARLLKSLPIKIIETVGSILGLFVASYTGVLLSSTAVPIWARAKNILGPLFLTSGLSTALASLSCILHRRQDTLERLDRAEMATLTTELGLISALLPLLGPLGKPLLRGRTGWLFKGGVVGGGLILPLLTRLGYTFTKKPVPRSLNTVLSLLVLFGGLILRHVWITAGRTSADDPEAVHYYNALGSKDSGK